MKYYTFMNLSNVAQMKACHDYAIGWKETHPEEDLTFAQVYDILLESTEDIYYKDGSLSED